MFDYFNLEVKTKERGRDALRSEQKEAKGDNLNSH